MMIRKQIYIAPEQEAKLKRLARATGRTEAEIIRQALDALPETNDPVLAALLSRGLVELVGPSASAAQAQAAYRRYLKQIGRRKLGLAEAVLEERRKHP
ncbi:MAG: ribbon-helix-helix domain-containing protein [Meiothermus sp.]|uniref:ribbon-helix-helix domain-containing protein n=1 Tax=Meiothermus sp. TaxID=1955249 RepID=UPI00262C61BD|nr:CopG family transcriptional regulator [Meiothermus sp.]MCS7059359.1 ribbon-helix-helix domain-containing protein [Meiothermus sp.]MDW8092000.1 CopG family transcriptional regulator [Meiothermus sp.]